MEEKVLFLNSTARKLQLQITPYKNAFLLLHLRLLTSGCPIILFSENNSIWRVI